MAIIDGFQPPDNSSILFTRSGQFIGICLEYKTDFKFNEMKNKIEPGEIKALGSIKVTLSDFQSG